MGSCRAGGSGTEAGSPNRCVASLTCSAVAELWEAQSSLIPLTFLSQKSVAKGQIGEANIQTQ